MRCTGLMGKQCSCGQWHSTEDNRPSMLASRWFWGSAIACSLLYGLASWLLS